jgi:cytochrome c oxidase subunit II
VKRGRLLLAFAPLIVLLAGCGGGPSGNALAPKSPQAHAIATLWWWMMGVGFFGLAVVVGLLVAAWVRRNKLGIGNDTEGPKAGERTGWFVVVIGGVIVPIGVIVALFVVSDIFIIRTTEAPAATATKMTVVVVGHQFWWEIRYPGTGAVTANEMHIPVRTPVRVEVRTADVIHSFWVPELNRKIQAIPGQSNAIELDADSTGAYLGYCAEFCGLQHAHMHIKVIVQSASAFRRWLARQTAPAATPPPKTPASVGEAVFLDKCASCHTIRGTAGSGTVGPDLTHLADRRTLAAVTIPNTPSYLAGWIGHAQSVKPGSAMPDIALSTAQVGELVAYLDSLK